jgi:hypothetical protein
MTQIKLEEFEQDVKEYRNDRGMDVFSFLSYLQEKNVDDFVEYMVIEKLHSMEKVVHYVKNARNEIEKMPDTKVMLDTFFEDCRRAWFGGETDENN